MRGKLKSRDHRDEDTVTVNTVPQIDITGILSKNVSVGFGKGGVRFRELTGQVAVLFARFFGPHGRCPDMCHVETGQLLQIVFQGRKRLFRPAGIDAGHVKRGHLFQRHVFAQQLHRHAPFFCDAQVFNTRHQSLVHCDGAGLPFAPLDVLGQHRLKRFGDQGLRGVDKGIEGVGFRQGFVAGME
ncbi:hypothetical protein, partial [Escherichia coli]|uniref:hypothetical protein n=1 Tax=Escherichia coli TaxID=562 RepID=UPI003D7704DB